MLHYDQLASVGEAEVKGGGENWNEADTVVLRPKEVHTQAFHKLGSYFMLR